MLLEKRTRVEIFLPIRSDSAEYQIITQWLAEKLAYARGGSTLTAPFTGLYTSTTQTNVIRDTIQVLFCDFNLDADIPEHREELVGYLDGLRLLLTELLNEEEVWTVYHLVTRVGKEEPDLQLR